MTGPTDELWARVRHLEAERMRPEKPLMPARVRGPMGELIQLLDRLLTDPGPPDPTSEEIDPEETQQ